VKILASWPTVLVTKVTLITTIIAHRSDI
jgi:hypothetical protein